MEYKASYASSIAESQNGLLNRPISSQSKSIELTNFSNKIPTSKMDGCSRGDWAKPVAMQTIPSIQERHYQASYVDQPPLPLPQRVVAHSRVRLFWWSIRYAIVFVCIFVGLLIPIVIFDSNAIPGEDAANQSPEEKQNRNLIYYLCLWLLCTWVFAVFSDIFGLALPYLFRFISRYVNPAHQRYWRIFRLMRRPICFLTTTIACWVFFTAWINLNPNLAVNINKDPNSTTWDDIIDDVLNQLILWVAFYFLEKIFISYTALHYHYRRSNVALRRTKNVHNALIILYEASLYLHPVHGNSFTREDMLIRNAKGGIQDSVRMRVSSYLARLGIDGYNIVSLFGSFMSDAPDAHWLQPGSSYAVIDRAWTNPSAAEALARRIWISFVAIGSHGLTEGDIVEVLGSDRKAEAASIFKTFDLIDSGEIQLVDFVGIVTETGNMRHNIYQTIADMDHCINTLDWFCLLVIAAVMGFFIAVQYIPSIKQIQSVLTSLAFGLSFAVGRTFNHLLTGIVFVFFDHPYDSGDVVNIPDPVLKVSTTCVVTRQSLLYTVFRRLDNNADVQIPNDQLAQRSIENYTRSGISRQSISLFVDIRTSFVDLRRLRAVLEDFVRQNPADYVPDSLRLNITSLHELNKMAIRVAFTHRNNWSEDKLRAQRSNKFYCALIAACRSIPIYKPGGMLPASGENGNPMYTTQLASPAEVRENINKERQQRQGLRWDNENGPHNISPEVEGVECVNEGTTKDPATTGGASNTSTRDKIEEEAYQNLSGLAGQRTVVSTCVDIPNATTGLRFVSRPREPPQHT